MSIVQMFNSSFFIMETAQITQHPDKRIKFNEKNEPKEILLKLLQFSKIPDIEIIDIEISVENQIFHMGYDEKINFVRIFEQQKLEQYKPLPIPKKFDYIKIIEQYADTSQRITITTYDLLNFDCVLTDGNTPIKLHYQMGISEHKDKTCFRFKIMDDSTKINLELTKSDTDLKISTDQIIKTFDGIPAALKSKIDDSKFSKFKKLFSSFSPNKKSEKEIPQLKAFAFIFAKDSFSIELEIEELSVTLFLSPKKISDKKPRSYYN